MADVKLVQAREAFGTTLRDGREFGVRVGDVFDASDPVVAGREHLFGEVRVRSSSAPAGVTAAATETATETATAAPGTRRAVSKASTTSKGARTDA